MALFISNSTKVQLFALSMLKHGEQTGYQLRKELKKTKIQTNPTTFNAVMTDLVLEKACTDHYIGVETGNLARLFKITQTGINRLEQFLDLAALIKYKAEYGPAATLRNSKSKELK